MFHDWFDVFVLNDLILFYHEDLLADFDGFRYGNNLLLSVVGSSRVE